MSEGFRQKEVVLMDVILQDKLSPDSSTTTRLHLDLYLLALSAQISTFRVNFMSVN